MDESGFDWGGFLESAGTVLAGVGLLTGKKDVAKIGGLMMAGSALADMNSPKPAPTTAPTGQYSAANDFGAGPAATTSVSQQVEAKPLGSIGYDSQGGMPQTFSSGVQPSSLAQTAMARVGPGSQEDAAAYAPPTQPQSAVAEAASRYTSNDLKGYLQAAWDKAKAAGTGVSDVLKNNKELVSIVGSAFGPEAERAKLEKQRLALNTNAQNFEQGIMARRLANLNSPVNMGLKPRTGA